MSVLFVVDMFILYVKRLKASAVQRGRPEVDPLSRELERRMHAYATTVDQKLSINKRFAHDSELEFFGEFRTEVYVDWDGLIGQKSAKAVVGLHIRELRQLDEAEGLTQDRLVCQVDCGADGLVNGTVAEVDLFDIELKVARGHDRVQTVVDCFVLVGDANVQGQLQNASCRVEVFFGLVCE